MPIETASEPNFGSVQRQMQRLMEQMQKNFFNFCPTETWTPNVNLYENDTAYVVCVDLAGIDKEKIELVVADQKLTLRGTRIVPTPASNGSGEPHPPRLRVHVMEIDHGPFCREVELPADVAHDQISAAHLNGLLWIELPKR
ncbi:MAG: small heat shock protein [Phycisphaerales bacterium]|nr:small heat shock protein [Phycisphaerales bacterium]